MEVDVIKLENNLEYAIFDTIQNGDNKYLFLGNLQDASDLKVRKVVKKEEREYLRKLDDKLELEEVMTLFNEKHIGKGEE